MTQPPQASRPSAPPVSPVDLNGIRYQQDMDSLRHGADQASGYLVAIDIASGTRLWMLKVYTVNAPTAPGLPTMARYFRSMQLRPGAAVLDIEDESGSRYMVDLATRQVTSLTKAPEEPAMEAPPPPPPPAR